MKQMRPYSRGSQKEYVLTRNYVTLGAYLQEMRLKTKLTQREVSIALGYSSAQFISNFERGIASPPHKKLKELIRLYRMPVEKVMNLVLEGERVALAAVLHESTPNRRRIARA